MPFHPKAFLVRTDLSDYVLAGSGNMSRSGLSRGIEAGLVVGVNRAGPTEPTASAAMQAMRAWFSTTWNSATQLTPTLLASYSQIFAHRDNLKAPTPTEDDVASTVTLQVTGGGLAVTPTDDFQSFGEGFDVLALHGQA